MVDIETYQLPKLKCIQYATFVPGEIYEKIRYICAYDLLSNESNTLLNEQIVLMGTAFFRLV